MDGIKNIWLENSDSFHKNVELDFFSHHVASHLNMDMDPSKVQNSLCLMARKLPQWSGDSSPVCFTHLSLTIGAMLTGHELDLGPGRPRLEVGTPGLIDDENDDFGVDGWNAHDDDYCLNFDETNNDALLPIGDYILANRSSLMKSSHPRVANYKRSGGQSSFEFVCESLQLARGGSMLLLGGAGRGEHHAVSTLSDRLEHIRMTSELRDDSFNVVFLNGYVSIFATIASRLGLMQSVDALELQECVLDYLSRPGRAVDVTGSDDALPDLIGASSSSSFLLDFSIQPVSMTVVVLDNVDMLCGGEVAALLMFIDAHPMCSVVLVLATCSLELDNCLLLLRSSFPCELVSFQRVESADEEGNIEAISVGKSTQIVARDNQLCFIH